MAASYSNVSIFARRTHPLGPKSGETCKYGHDYDNAQDDPEEDEEQGVADGRARFR